MSTVHLIRRKYIFFSLICFAVATESGVMCCDVHPKYPFLLVIGTISPRYLHICCDNYNNFFNFVGMFDGNVAVYNLQTNPSQPIYMSRGIYGKHLDIVWEVKWGIEMQDGEINFYSISADGTVYNWILMQNKLSLTTISILYLDQQFDNGPDGNMVKLKGFAHFSLLVVCHAIHEYFRSYLAAGTCMVFHPKQPNLFLVGTEEGLIFKCSTEFSSRYLMTYSAHYLPVYRIDINKYNANIFVSCGADWRVKIWEDMRRYYYILMISFALNRSLYYLCS